MSTKQRLFIGCYPTGLVYADTEQEVDGDYKRLAYLSYSTLVLELEHDCPRELAEQIKRNAVTVQSRRGEQFQVSHCGQTVTLGKT